jgi:hypothetical protein
MQQVSFTKLTVVMTVRNLPLLVEPEGSVSPSVSILGQINPARIRYPSHVFLSNSPKDILSSGLLLKLYVYFSAIPFMLQPTPNNHYLFHLYNDEFSYK